MTPDEKKDTSDLADIPNYRTVVDLFYKHQKDSSPGKFLAELAVILDEKDEALATQRQGFERERSEYEQAIAEICKEFDGATDLLGVCVGIRKLKAENDRLREIEFRMKGLDK